MNSFIFFALLAAWGYFGLIALSAWEDATQTEVPLQFVAAFIVMLIFGIIGALSMATYMLITRGFHV